MSSLETSQTVAVSSEPRGEADGGKEEPEKNWSSVNVFDTAAITPEDAWAVRFSAYPT